MEILGAPRRWTQANPDETQQGRDTDLAIRESVRLLLVLCAAVQSCASIYYGLSISGSGTMSLALSAMISGGLCLLAWKRWRHWPSQLTGYVVGGVFAVLLVHSLLRVAYDPHYGQPGGTRSADRLVRRDSALDALGRDHRGNESDHLVCDRHSDAGLGRLDARFGPTGRGGGSSVDPAQNPRTTEWASSERRSEDAALAAATTSRSGRRFRADRVA